MSRAPMIPHTTRLRTTLTPNTARGCITHSMQRKRLKDPTPLRACAESLTSYLRTLRPERPRLKPVRSGRG
jgi:hypothetical protein